MSNFYAVVSGNKTDLDNIFTIKGNDISNNIITKFICDGQDLGERYYIIPEGTSGTSHKYNITGQYTFLYNDAETDFMNIFSQNVVYNFSITSENGQNSSNPESPYRFGLGVTFTFQLITNATSTFQIGKILGGQATDVEANDSGNVHKNGGNGGAGIVIFMKSINDTGNVVSGNICFIGGGGGAGGYNLLEHHLGGKGGYAGTTINASNVNFNFYHGGDGGAGWQGGGYNRNVGEGGYNDNTRNVLDPLVKYNGGDGLGENLRFGGGAGGAGFQGGYAGESGGNDRHPYDSGSGGGAGGSKIINNGSNLFSSDTLQIVNVNAVQNSYGDVLSITINNNDVNTTKLLSLEHTFAYDNETYYSIDHYTS